MFDFYLLGKQELGFFHLLRVLNNWKFSVDYKRQEHIWNQVHLVQNCTWLPTLSPSFPMWCGAGSTTSLTSAFLMGEAGTEALTERGAVRPGDHTQCPGWQPLSPHTGENWDWVMFTQRGYLHVSLFQVDIPRQSVFFSAKLRKHSFLPAHIWKILLWHVKMWLWVNAKTCAFPLKSQKDRAQTVMLCPPNISPSLIKITKGLLTILPLQSFVL